MIPPQHFTLSSKSIKIRFAYRFLRALKKLNKPKRTTTTTTTTNIRYRLGGYRSTYPVGEEKRRYQMVKTAAYASMASAVGSKRAWSRALLYKIRNRSKKVRSSFVLKKTKGLQENPKKAEELLQKLIPGGENMDFSSLLDESAHYIKCLTFQVQIMRNFVDFYSG